MLAHGRQLFEPYRQQFLRMAIRLVKLRASVLSDGCGRGNRAGGSHSYRLRLSERLGPGLRRQVEGSLQIGVNVGQMICNQE